MVRTKNRLLSSFFWSFLEQGGTRIVSLILQIVLARILMPEAFGVMAILLVLIEVANTIVQSGFGAALIQRQEATDRSFTTAFWLSLCFAAVLYSIVFFAAPALAAFYGMADLSIYLRVLALILFVEAFNSIQRSYLQKEMHFRALFNSNIAASIGSGVVGVTLALLGFGVWALVAQALSQALLACFVMLIQVPWRPSFHFETTEARALFSYGWKICVTGILNTLYLGLSELILGKVCSPADLGVYSQGRKWPNAAISMVSNALQNVFFPAFAEIQSDKEALRGAIQKAVVVGSYLIMPTALFVAVAAEPLVALLLTEKWLACVLVFQLVCVQNLGLMLGIVNLRAYMALGHSGLYLKLQLIKVLSGLVIISGIAILLHNIYWVALAACVHGLLCVFIDLAPAKRMHGLGSLSQIRSVMPTLFVALLAAGLALVPLAFDISYALQLLLQIAIYVGVYLACSRVFKLRGLQECFTILSDLRSR